MASSELQAEVLLTAFGLYALVVVALTLWNARAARRDARRLSSGGLDEARPGRHVLDERRAQALVGQIFGGDR